MTEAGQLNRRVTFQQQALDANNDRLGAWTDVVTRDARVQSLKGTEAVQGQRLAGVQPVVIYVRRDTLTKAVDNSYRAVDARDSTIVWDITSKVVSEDLCWVEILATERTGDNA